MTSQANARHCPIISARAELEKQGRRAQELWLACQTLSATIEQGHAHGGNNDSGRRKPLAGDLEAIREMGASNPFISAIIESFPRESVTSGVWTEASLYERFEQVYRVARKVALVDETGGSLYKYALSYVTNWFVIPYGKTLRADSVVDDSISQYALLDSARYHMIQGNFELAIRLVNQLRGEARRVASDWLKEARLTLEAKQAAKCLITHSAAAGMTTVL